MKPTIVAVDLSAIFHMNYEIASAKGLTPYEQFHACMTATISKVNHLRTLDVIKNPNIVICCDDKKNWRKDIDPSYKGNRSPKDAGFHECLERTKERLSKDGFPLLQAEGFEADDVIASLCQASQAHGLDVIVASPDKDLLQLVGDHCPTPGTDYTSIKQIRTHKMFLDDDVTVKIYDEKLVESEFGVPPRKLADYLAIVGDKTDNIFGIMDVGGKSATAILSHFGTLSGLLDAVEKRDEDKLGVEPWHDFKELNRCSKALTAFFRPDESGKAYNAISQLAKNRILVGLKSDVPIDMADVLRERKVEKLTTSDDEPENNAVVMGHGTDTTPRNGAIPPDQREQDAVYINNPVNKSVTEPDATPTKTKEIATVPQRSIAMQQFDASLQPTGMEAVYWYAKRAIESRAYLKKFSNEDAALMAIMRGKDYGMTMPMALETLNIIEGKIALPASYMVTLCRKNPNCEYFDIVDEGEDFCTVETKRKSDGKVFKVTFTMAMAELAGLVKPKSNWEKWKPDMLYSRAVSRLARRVWAESLNGAYSIEEMSDSQ